MTLIEMAKEIKMLSNAILEDENLTQEKRQEWDNFFKGTVLEEK